MFKKFVSTYAKAPKADSTKSTEKKIVPVELQKQILEFFIQTSIMRRKERKKRKNENKKEEVLI